jgi:curli biogenesis system outer membrane secretion channel CsgG
MVKVKLSWLIGYAKAENMLSLPLVNHKHCVTDASLTNKFLIGLVPIVLSGCAVISTPISSVDAPQSVATQKAAQQAVMTAAPTTPTLKRKIALGRISNETSYGQSLLRDNSGDPLGKQVTDLMSKALTSSGAYLVFERPDIGRLQAESNLTDKRLNLVGVDALVIGSLTEFGRKTVGSTGFLSASKRQVAFAKIDIRVVDISTGLVFFAASGAGEASTETVSIWGYSSQASYDGTLNDAAIRQAVSEAVSRLTTEMSTRPWETSILKLDGNQIFLGGGQLQGIKPGMQFSVYTVGEKVRSTQTGSMVTLPGRMVASVRVDGLFGDNELNQGSVATVTSGSVVGFQVNQLTVRFDGAK